MANAQNSGSQRRIKKLIEAGIPLRDIDKESTREKSLRYGMPNTIHLYWSRKPLATCRTILFAQLVDDPASRPDLYPTKEQQEKRRQELFDIMRRLAKWENRNDSQLYAKARKAIRLSNHGKLPEIFDPFSGSGSIPLEAQRLGMKAHASDLNPLAVIINKAMIEIPYRFCDYPSIHPGENVRSENRAEGLADDIAYYGKMLRDKAFNKIGNLYPKVMDEYGEKHTVIAWIWARTVKNPNPAHPVMVPLVNSWWLSKKKGHEAWIKPIVTGGAIYYQVQHNANGPINDKQGTVSRRGAVSIVDGSPITLKYIRQQGKKHLLGRQLIAIVGDSSEGRIYVSPDKFQADKARVKRPDSYPSTILPDNPQEFNTPNYGMNTTSSLFTNRQLTALTTLSNLIPVVRQQVESDALKAGMPEGKRLDDGGNGAAAYADAIAVYLALTVSNETDWCCSLCSWANSVQKMINLFTRQAIPMSWGYAEVNPFSSSSGNYFGQVKRLSKAVVNLPAKPVGEAHIADAMTCDYRDYVISTDPPYYDNIDYSDLSDYFYTWLRPILRNILPPVTATIQTPKANELVANPYRSHSIDKKGKLIDGPEAAANFFNKGFLRVFTRMRRNADLNNPITVYYAYKQKSAKKGALKGWYTILDALICAGWEITATLPIHSERSGRMGSNGTNSLASSIVLSCRPRPIDAPSISFRIFSVILQNELNSSLSSLIHSGIDPVDLDQAAIGPGISVYSRYSRIRKADGSDLSVSEALEIINRNLDEVLHNADIEYDTDTRFALQWYERYGWSLRDSGEAIQLAQSSDTNLDDLTAGGILSAHMGKTRLFKPSEMTEKWDPRKDARISLWEAMIRLAGIVSDEQKGIDDAGLILARLRETSVPFTEDDIHTLSFRLYREAEKRQDTEGALAFNNLATSWGQVVSKADDIESKKASGVRTEQGKAF